MGKSSKKEPARPAQEARGGRAPSFGIIFLILILGGIAVFALTRNKQYEPPPQQSATPPPVQSAPEPQYSPSVQEQTPQQNVENQASAPEAEFRVPAYFENPDSAEPLQPVLAPSTVPYFAREGYEVAQRKPRLMTQLPCFCYCDKFGHTSLHTCFETTHAVHCDVCLKEALEADRMDSQGLSPQEIREFIIQQYKPRGNHNHS